MYFLYFYSHFFIWYFNYTFVNILFWLIYWISKALFESNNHTSWDDVPKYSQFYDILYVGCIFWALFEFGENVQRPKCKAKKVFILSLHFFLSFFLWKVDRHVTISIIFFFPRFCWSFKGDQRFFRSSFPCWIINNLWKVAQINPTPFLFS